MFTIKKLKIEINDEFRIKKINFKSLDVLKLPFSKKKLTSYQVFF